MYIVPVSCKGHLVTHPVPVSYKERLVTHPDMQAELLTAVLSKRSLQGACVKSRVILRVSRGRLLTSSIDHQKGVQKTLRARKSMGHDVHAYCKDPFTQTNPFLEIAMNIY